MNLKSIVKVESLRCALICFLIGLISVGSFIVAGKGIFVLRDDFNVQQIVFSVAAHNSIVESGLHGWTWGVDLGSSTLQSFSFYELGSPFFWLSMLFPATWFPYLIGWILILKYSIAGLTSCMYLSRFLQDKKWAIVGGVLYAFSGYASTNLLYYHFHDVLAFFPLLLIGIEQLCEEKKYSLFVFSVAINCLLNYYFFTEEVVFLILYFLFRFWDLGILELVKNACRCMICGVVGIGMAAVLFLPSAIYILGNSRTEAEIVLKTLVRDTQSFLFVVKSLILPGETMHSESSIYLSNWDSAGSYLPMVGLGLVLAYVLKNKTWLSRLLITLFLISFSPLLCSAFLLMMEADLRWWFVLTIMLALATCYVLEKPIEYPVRKSTVIYFGCIVVFYGLLRFVKWDYWEESIIFSNKKLMLLCAIAGSGALLTLLCSGFDKNRYHMVLAGVCMFAVLTTGMNIYFYRANAQSPEEYYHDFSFAKQLNPVDSQYRFDTTSNVYTMVGNASGFAGFTSARANSIAEFEALFGFHSTNRAIDKHEYPGLAELLAGKYRILEEPDGEPVIQEYDVGGKHFYISEQAACPIGFAVRGYLSEQELEDLPQNQRGIALLSSAVIRETNITGEIAESLKHMSQEEIDFERPISQYVADAVSNRVLNFSRNSEGFNCDTDYSEDSWVYFSVPYDSGWKASVDGIVQPIVPSGGMMLLKVPSGMHSVEFRYYVPGLHAGILVSIAFCILFSMLAYVETKGKKTCIAG